MSLINRIFHDSSSCQSAVLILLVVLTVMSIPPTESEALELRLADGSEWQEGQTLPPPPPNAQPVLFVHGHGTSVCGALNPFCSCSNPGANCDYFRRTWMNSLSNGLRSFADAIDHNPQLNLVPYYINFIEDERSIVEDAGEIGEAVERILARHNPGFAAQPNRQSPPAVQVAIIAHSKGTISTRLYLKSLYVSLPANQALPGPYPNFHPVSEFIAIAGPNHGTAIWRNPNRPLFRRIWTVAQLLKEPIHQLNNGYTGDDCDPFIFPRYASAFEFMEELNGHAMTDTHELTYIANGNQFGNFPQEAPGSRVNGELPIEGPLYVSMFDGDCRDGVGCHQPRILDCEASSHVLPFQGRGVAANLAPNAVNMAMQGIDGGSDPEEEGSVAHINIVHDGDTICKALYTVAHHVADPNITCSGGNLPVVPAP